MKNDKIKREKKTLNPVPVISETINFDGTVSKRQRMAEEDDFEEMSKSEVEHPTEEEENNQTTQKTEGDDGVLNDAEA